MKKLVLMITALMACLVVRAADKVTIEYNGATATVTIPSGLAAYVTCSSGTSSHVKLKQSDAVGAGTSGEITYELSGSSDDGEFYLEGSYKCSIDLKGLNLNNPTGPAIDIEDGKRINVSAKKDTESTLSDGTDGNWKACLYGKGHFEFSGKGKLNVVGNTAHAISCKEYLQVKNLTLNITGAKKDGLHCKQYFMMESGTINISGVEDDGIQVELEKDEPYTGALADHEDGDVDENSGNCYFDDGTLTIGECGTSVIKTDGQVVINGGKQNYDNTKVLQNQNPATGISALRNDVMTGEAVYDLSGRQLKNGTQRKGVVIIRNGNEIQKVIVK